MEASFSGRVWRSREPKSYLQSLPAHDAARPKRVSRRNAEFGARLLEEASLVSRSVHDKLGFPSSGRLLSRQHAGGWELQTEAKGSARCGVDQNGSLGNFFAVKAFSRCVH